MMIIGFIGALLVGFSLGLTGGGGSLLALPVMVYLHKIDPELARTYSLFIIAAGALVGTIQAAKNKMVDFKTALLFLVPSFVAIFVMSTFVYPIIPKEILQIGDFRLDKGGLIMLIFAVVMLGAAVAMIKNGLSTPEYTKGGKNSIIKPVLIGLLVGTLTELIGAGGGFLIVPSLVLFFRMPMHLAIGTSLFIILLNTLSGIVFHINTENIDWLYLAQFTGLAVVGLFFGSHASKFIKGPKLKVGFGVFILLMGTFVLLEKFIN